eukprot:m.248972 g.248972  ORF g.248972 m.248972 type:complete len:302 (+) comp15904_c0_seq1:73-978(+)
MEPLNSCDLCGHSHSAKTAHKFVYATFKGADGVNTQLHDLSVPVMCSVATCAKGKTAKKMSVLELILYIKAKGRVCPDCAAAIKLDEAATAALALGETLFDMLRAQAVVCPCGCDIGGVTQEGLPAHLQTCPKRRIECPWRAHCTTARCKAKIMQGQLKEHEPKCVSYLTLLAQSYKTRMDALEEFRESFLDADSSVRSELYTFKTTLRADDIEWVRGNIREMLDKPKKLETNLKKLSLPSLSELNRSLANKTPSHSKPGRAALKRSSDEHKRFAKKQACDSEEPEVSLGGLNQLFGVPDC